MRTMARHRRQKSLNNQSGAPDDTTRMARQLVDRERQPAGTVGSVVVARQPILDRDGSVCGFELLYRPLPVSGEGPADPEAASASVMLAGLADIGLERLVADQPAYINVTRQLLVDVRHLPLPPRQIVLELVENQTVDDLLLRILRELIDQGFRIALDDFVLTPESEPLLELASVVKLDVRALDRASLLDHLERLRDQGPILIAEKVETHAEYHDCRELGFDAFQGYYFATPALIHGKRTPTRRLKTLASLVGTDHARWTFDALERVITQDAGLSHRFLRLANSAYFARRTPVGSIHEGLVRLGTVAVRRWTLLLLLSGIADQPHQLLATGLQRARLCELLAAQYPTATPERTFTTGLLSILDALLDQPMHELLAELPLDDNIATALLERHGTEGRILAAVEAYERGDFDAVSQHGITLPIIADAYQQAVQWVDETTTLLS